MNELIKAMANDMGIYPYQNEPEVSYFYRIIYSGLGQWCLKSASSPKSVISKHAQSAMINKLVDKYTTLFQQVSESFKDETLQFSVFLRRVYEEIGYLITDHDNRNKLANYGRTLKFGNKILYFGICENCLMEGLGVYSKNEFQASSWRDVLIRDDMNWKQYINSQYSIVNFDKRDINCDELQFFDPLSYRSPSASWSNTMTTDMSVARKTVTGPFYRVMKFDGELLFCDDLINATGYELTAYEYRRLYFALKSYYNNPIRAQIFSLDNEYSKIVLDGHLPNREYYFILLFAWPNMCFSNKREFIIKNENIELLREIFKNSGIKTIGG